MRSAPLRLLAVSHTGLVSGAEAVLSRALVAGTRRGWNVSCLCPPGPFADRLSDAGITTTAMPELKLPSGPRPVALARWGVRSARAAAVLRREGRGHDLVLANGILALPALRMARLGPPVAWLVHDVIHQRDWRLVLRACGPAVDLAVAVSRAVEGPLADAGLATRVVRNGTPWPVAPARTGRAGPPVVGCCALLTAWKGQDVLLEAVAALDRHDVEVELVGATFPKDAPFEEVLRRCASRPDLDGRVRFLGHVDDPLERMRRWRLAVSASVDPEAAPLNVLEAMSIGVPVVATDHGGSPEVLGDAGLLVAPRDPSALGEAIGRLLDDPVLYARCAQAGPVAVAERLSADDRLAELMDVLEGLAPVS